MRFGILMIIATCWLCVQFNKCVQLVRPGSDGKPIYRLPAVTREELDAAHAARAERIRHEGLPAVAVASAADNF